MTEFLEVDDLYKEKFPNVCTAVKTKTQKCCTINTVKNFFPISKWLPEYKPKYLVNDFVAGLTVGLTTIPQAIAYGTVAGLPPQFGLYSAFMGCFAYIIFGTCKDITVGPTAIMSLMVQLHVTGSADYAVLACFLSGCIILLMGFLNLGVLVQFISIPVTTGFTMAAAITIASGQVNSLFGMKSPSNDFLVSWEHFFTHLPDIVTNDTILGICTLAFLLLMRKVKDLPSSYRLLTKYISLSRNALAVIVGILLCYLLRDDKGNVPFRVSGEITPGVPPFKLPPFSTMVNGEKVNFGGMISSLGASLASIPLIAVLESIAIAKAFSRGKIIDASQEMIALGFCNFLSSFFSSMPITGSFTRTAINNSSGVKTPLGGAVTGTLILLALAFLTSTFYYIPKATLSAIIIAAMIYMIEYDRIAEIWRSKKSDFFPFLVTVLCCLFWSLEYGIVCGIFANLIFILYKSARPQVQITQLKVEGLEVGLVEIVGNLGYSSAEYLKGKSIKFIANSSSNSNKPFLIINGEKIKSIDSTVAFNLISLMEDLALLNCQLICWNWNSNAAGVICRVHKKDHNLFKVGRSLDDVIKTELQNSLYEDKEVSIIRV